MVLLPSSSFFWSPYLQLLLPPLNQSNEINDKELTLALTLGLTQAHQYVFDQSEKHSQAWFYYGYKLAASKPKVAYELGLYFDTQHNKYQAELWYKTAVNLQYLPAVMTLAKFYQRQQQYSLAKALLQSFQQYSESFNLLLTLAVRAGDEDLIKQLVITKHLTVSSKQLIKELSAFNIINHHFVIDSTLENNRALEENHILETANTLAKKNTNKTSSALFQRLPVEGCNNSISIFATSLENLRLAEKWVGEFQRHPLANSVCFTKPRYIPISKLHCDHPKNTAITCDESIWQNYHPAIESKYLLVVMPEGGANVNSGIVYLDSADNADVFSHEISHLLGFIDEYPLRKGHQVCQQRNFKGLNLTVLARSQQGERQQVRAKILAQIPWGRFVLPSTPILQRKGNRWLLGTPEKYRDSVGIFLAKTCEKNHKFAFKPLYDTTQLEYFETKFPLFYLTLIQKNNQFLMPSFKVRWQ